MHRDYKLEGKIAESRIARLFEMAKNRTLLGDGLSEKLARRYVKLMLEISRHYKVPLPVRIKGGVCKHCHAVLVPGLNCRVRISGGFAIYKCSCGKENKSHLGR